MDDLVKRADEALKDVTPGPWEAVFNRQTWGWLEVDGPSFNVSAPTRATDLSLADAVQRKKDARFIAAARELVPAMRDRIEADAKRIAEAVKLLDERDREYNRLTNEMIERHAARTMSLAAANARLRGVLSGHQIWDSAEKVSADEFVLWAPDGHVAIRLKVTHRHDQLSEAGLEFLTCDLLDLLNARAALEGEKP